MSDEKHRTKTACDHCRKRKIKCNGDNPCINCQHNNKICQYTVVKEKKTRGKGRTNNKLEIQNINKRLSLLEKLLVDLSKNIGTPTLEDAHKIKSDHHHQQPQAEDDDNDSPYGSPSVASMSTVSPTITNDSSNDNDDDITKPHTISQDPNHDTSSDLIQFVNEPITKGQQQHGHKPKLDIDVGKPPTIMQETNPHTSHSVFDNSDKIGPSFGCHTIFSIFSKPSFNWLKTKINDESFLMPIKNIPIIYNLLLKNGTTKFISPPPKDFILARDKFGYFPNKQLIFEILNCYFDEFFLFNYICPKEQILGYFNNYYNKTNYSFKYSELILMNCIISLCLSLKVVNDTDKHKDYPTLKHLNDQQIYELKQSFFENALCYYDKINVMNEGIITVQCLAYMILYIEGSYACDNQFVYVLSGLLIRYAEDLGLNDITKIKSHDMDLCRRIWWFCEFIDLDTAYKVGSSPLITDNLSTNTELDEGITKVPLDISNSDFKQLSNNALTISLNENCLDGYLLYCFLVNMRIERKSFNSLFTVGAQNENKSSELFYSKLHDINNCIFQMINSMDPCIRPTIHNLNMPVFANTDQCQGKFHKNQHFTITYLQMYILSHIILINRAPLYQDVEIDDLYNYHLNISYEASKSLIHLILDLNAHNNFSNVMLNWLIFFPFSGFITLLSHCICHPTSINLDRDVRLLIRLAKEFFHTTNITQIDDLQGVEEKVVFYDVLVRILLKLLIDILQVHGHNYYDDDLNNYFADIKGVFNRLLGEQTERFRIMIKSFVSCFKGGKKVSPEVRLEPNLVNLINYDEDERSLPANLPNFFG